MYLPTVNHVQKGHILSLTTLSKAEDPQQQTSLDQFAFVAASFLLLECQ